MTGDYSQLTHPSLVPTLDLAGHYKERQVLNASRPRLNNGVPHPVIMIGSRGPMRGDISTLPSRILIGCNGKFVDAFLMTLDEEDGETRAPRI
jgi:hypothetical protein